MIGNDDSFDISNCPKVSNVDFKDATFFKALKEFKNYAQPKIMFDNR